MTSRNKTIASSTVITRQEERVANPPKLIASIKEVEKRFGKTHALQGVNLDLHAGQVHVLLGENGAGKSTLAKVIAGLIKPDKGTIALADEHTHPSDVSIEDVAIVHQETAIVPRMTVLDNVTLGNTNAFAHKGIVNKRQLLKFAQETLDNVLPGVDPNVNVEELPGSKKHLVAFARALLSDPRILILDEPTAMLGLDERDILYKVVRAKRQEGLATLYVTHHLDEVAKVGDAVTVMRDGQVVAECAPDAREADLVTLIAGRSVHWKERPEHSGAVRSGKAILNVNQLCLENALVSVDMTAQAGDILGVYGVGQSGSDQLAEVLSGHAQADSGTITITANEIKKPTVARMNEAGLVYLPGERGRNGIVPKSSIRDNINLSSNDQVSRWGIISRERASNQAAKLASMVRVQGASLAAPISSLSGGNMQKALLARLLGRNAQVLILKDPTVGVDVGSRDDIYAVLRDQAAQGRAVILVTSDIHELVALSDRAVIMYRGRIAAELEGPEAITEERVLNAALGFGTGTGNTGGRKSLEVSNGS